MTETRTRNRARLVTLAAVAAAAAILAAQLLVPPIVGLPNNGQFERVLGYAGLNYQSDASEDKYFTHIVREFQFAPIWFRSGYLSSEIALARLARDLAALFAKDGLFDLRVLGALHALLLLAALAALVWACGVLTPVAQLVAAASLTFFFTDVGYAAALNSFFSQTAGFLFLMLTVAIAALAIRRGRLGGMLLLAYFLCAIAFVGSKPQESIQGPLLALFALRLAGARRRSWWRQPVVWLAFLLCLFSVWYYRRTDPVIRRAALYQTVFAEMLPGSPDPARDLETLGLDPDLARYSGKSAHEMRATIHGPAFQKEFFDRVGFGDIVAFYAARPGRLLDRLSRAAHHGGLRLRPRLRGNFERTAPGYRPYLMTERFAAWSDLRFRLAPVAPAWLILLLGGSLAVSAAGWRRSSGRGRLLREAMMCLVFLAVVEFLVCAFADRLADVARHLFVFHALCDLILAANLTWCAQTAAALRRPVSIRTPPNHREGASMKRIGICVPVLSVGLLAGCQKSEAEKTREAAERVREKAEQAVRDGAGDKAADAAKKAAEDLQKAVTPGH